MVKNTAIKDFISFLPMPALTIDHSGFILVRTFSIKKNLSLIGFQIKIKLEYKLFYLLI